MKGLELEENIAAYEEEKIEVTVQETRKKRKKIWKMRAETDKRKRQKKKSCGKRESMIFSNPEILMK